MDARLLDYYNRELQFTREMGAEFARAYPRVAARLGIDGLECADPYVERLLEGFAFLAARVQLKLDARFPDFTRHLLEVIYPNYLGPVPSAAVAEFTPDLKEGSLKEGLTIQRGSTLRTPLSKGERTVCEFRTAHEMTLWPLAIEDAKYLSGSGSIGAQGLTVDARAKAAIRLTLRSSPGIAINTLATTGIDVFIKATPALAARIYEQIHANVIGVVARAPVTGAAAVSLPNPAVVEVGFEDSQAMLPVPRAGFGGFRLLQEYFLLPDRFLFFGLRQLARAFALCPGERLEIFMLLDRPQAALENALDPAQFRLNCTPIINLFPKSCDRLELRDGDFEHHLLPDRNRPMDFEVFAVDKVTGISARDRGPIEVAPLYSARHRSAANEDRAFFTVTRRPRLQSTRQNQTGERTSYTGSESFLSIVDSAERPQKGELRQLDIRALCTNRDLPMQMNIAKGRTDFLLEGGAPIESIRCISGPTMPRGAAAQGESAWRLVNHLSLNYLSIDTEGVPLLKELLSLYTDNDDAVAQRQVDGVSAVRFDPVVRRLPIPGPISHGRGLWISLTLDDASFEGSGIVPLGGVLARFFARYVTINSFVQVRVLSATRGEVKQWPVMLGTRQLL